MSYRMKRDKDKLCERMKLRISVVAAIIGARGDLERFILAIFIKELKAFLK